MNPNNKKIEISEAILHIAFQDNFEREMAALLDEPSIQVFSSRHEARMQKLFRTERRRDFCLSAFAVSKRAAAILVVAIALLFGALLANQEVRASVVRTIIEWHQQFTRFRFEGSAVPGNIEGWRISYIPEGFAEYQNTTLGDLLTIIKLVNEQNETVVLEFAYAESMSISVGNNKAEHEIILYSNLELHIFHGTSDYQRNRIVWYNLGYAFLLQSYLPIEDMQRIAVSVIPIR